MDADLELEVQLCTSAQQLRQAWDVRLEVFVKEQGFDVKDERDQYDPIAAHFLLVSKSNPDRALGTLRLLPYPIPPTDPGTAGADAAATSDPANDPYPLGASQSESSLANGFARAIRSGKEGAGARLGRLALRKEVRGGGRGQRMLRAAEAWLMNVLAEGGGAREGADGPIGQDVGEALPTKEESDGLPLHSFTIRLSSQVQARGFYEKSSYVVEGEPYDEDGQPHILCSKQLIFAQR